MINEMVTIEVKATEYQRLIKQSVKQINAIERVRELHKPFSKSEVICDCCACIYPCPTIKALDGEQ